MKLLFCMLAITIAVSAISSVAGQSRIEGTTRCRIGPFMMERRECHCASNNKNFICNAILRDPPAKSAERMEGTMECIAGPFMMEERQCHCASNGKNFMC